MDIGVARNLPVAGTSGFSTGKFVYMFGPGTNSNWVWLRGEIASLNSTSLTVIPRNTGTTAAVVQFAAPPTIFLEEAVSIYLSGGAVQTPDLRQRLAERIGVPVVVADPFKRVILGSTVDAPPSLPYASEFAVAVGLSQRRPGDE